MTADERIEKLLNRFGQTISDLPKAEDYKWTTKYEGSIHAASNCAEQWYGRYGIPEDFSDEVLPAYICHLADVIDRMEIALETAFNQLEEKCGKCSIYDCQGNCRDFFRLRDELLIDPEVEIDDAD